jgi:cell division protein FtsL
MNMMSSHLTIKGCGLLVPADATGSEAVEETASDIVEYVVRELSTPPNSDIGRRKSSLHYLDLSSSFMGGEPEEVPDYSRATLERRPGSELGANVYNLALDILEGRTGNQRIFKLSRAKTLLRSGRPMAGDESLWLVPIRTARSVLAVVRVSVELPRKGEHQSMRSRNPSSVDILVDSDSSKADRIEEAMRQEADLLEAAQSNMINFAEVVAPLCVAALLIEKLKARGDYLSESVDKSTSQMRLLTKEVSAGTKKCALLSSAIAAIGSTAAIDFASTCAPSEMLQSFCDRVATALSTQLSGEVKIHVQRDTAAAISEEGSPMPLASSSPHPPLVTAKSNSEATNNTSSSGASEPPSYSEALLDHDGRSFGKVVFTPRTPPPLVEEDAAASRPVPQSLNFLAVHPLTAVGEAVFALRPICSVLAGLLLLIRREMALLTNASSLALQVRLKDESIGAKSEELSACTRRYEQEVAANNFYKDLSDAAKQCVVCLTTDRTAAVDDDPSHVHLEEGDQKFVVRSTLLNMLTALSRQLASLVGRPSSVSFGVLDLTARTHLTTPDSSREEEQQQAMDDLLEKSVFWVHGHSSSSESPAPPGRLDWQHVHVGARDILLNLANSCIAKRSKSVFDIGMSPDMHYGSSSLSDSKHEPQSDQMIVRVLTYPLLSRGESDQGCCGVLQCLLDPRGGSYSNAHVEYLCEYMAHTVSCVLTVEVQQQKLHVKVLRRKLSQLTAEEASTELQQSKLMWQQRALTWRKFARFACDALSPNHVFDDVTELFKSQAAAAALAEMGIRSTLKRGSLTDQEMNKWSATEAAGLTRLPVAPSLVPLTESNDVFLELTCDPSTEEDLHRDSAELIASVAEVIRNTVSVQKVVDAISKDSEAVNGRAALRIEELQVELCRSKEDIMASESKSAEVIGRNEELSSERAELERKCSELSKTQSELSRDCQRLSKDCRASVLWIDKFRALASMSLYKLCAPAASDIAGLLVGSIAELQQQQAPSPSSPAQRMKTVKEMNDWNYESIAKVLDRSIMRIGGGALVHHASILVRTAVTDSLSPELLQVRVFEGGKPSSDAVHTIVASKNEQTVLSSYRSSKHAMQANAAASVVSESIVEQCLRHGGTMEVGEEMVQAIDLVGINYAALSTIFDSGPSAKPTVSCSLLCVSLHPVSAAGQQQASSAVIRILYQQPTGAAVDTARLVVDRVEMQKLRSLELEMFNASLLRPLVEIVATIGCAVMQVSSDLQRRSLVSEGAQDIAEKGRVETELSQLQLSRIRKLHRVVCREAGALLDPPLVGPVGIYTGTGEGMRAVHPAALTPLSASQDTCLKLLSVIRTLLRSEGQALLLRDNHTAAADPAVASYQVIYTGDCLVWAGIEPSAFGVITASGRAAGRESLVESTMRSRRCLHTMNAPNDPRYYAYLDGICDLGTPVLMVPMRGRGGSVVGTLVAARGKGATAFSSEDVIAAEICSSFGALSLYWCQGMGSLHQQLLKNTHKMDKLEKLVKKLGDAAS